MALVEKLTPETVSRPWGSEQWIVHTPDYSGKVLRYKAGHAGGLQYHVLKDETFMLLSGRAILRCDDGGGYLTAVLLEPGDAYRFPPYAVHQVEAVTDCMGIEWSTPQESDRVRVEERYGVEAQPGAGASTWDVLPSGEHVARRAE